MTDPKISRHVKKGPRDPARIPDVLSWVAIYWKRHPDLRLGQLLGNMADMSDPYHLEDDVLLQRIKKEMLND